MNIVHIIIMLSPGIILPQCPHQDHGDETNLNRESSLTHKDQEIKNFKLCCGQCDGAGAGGAEFI